ncbi:MAG: PKD domain-containing protein [Candidatus Binatia bacterium]|nr:PKD domain-containing protein [Candidatus Binatia bacterium]
MRALRSWSITLAGCIAGTTLLLAGCTQPDTADTPTPAAEAPAATEPAAAKASAVPIIIDELYVDAEAEPDEGTPPLIVMFTSIVEDHTGDFTCEWDFGDGTPKSSELNPKHTYKKEGDFIVTLVCKDTKGVEGETEIDVTVYEYE